MLATSFFMSMALAYSSRGMKVSFPLPLPLPLPHRCLSSAARGVLGAAHLHYIQIARYCCHCVVSGSTALIVAAIY